MTAPETLEELRQAVRDEACNLLGAAEILPGRFPAAAIPVAREVADRLLRLVPPAPEPIKVGDRVRRPDDGDDVFGVVLAIDDERLAWVRWETEESVWRTTEKISDLTRVDPSPSPEPEPQEAPEPHESEDPEELAAAVAAGLRVEPRIGGRWRRRQTLASTAFGFGVDIKMGVGFRIHGTVPGYETGGAS